MFRRSPAGPRYLLILDGNRNWGFPKGHLRDGESPLDAARREVAEETGLADLVLHGELGVIDWYFRARGELIHKDCHLFLFESPYGDVVPQSEEGITACSWHSLEEALRSTIWENSRTVLQAAARMVGAPDGERKTALGS